MIHPDFDLDVAAQILVPVRETSRLSGYSAMIHWHARLAVLLSVTVCQSGLPAQTRDASEVIALTSPVVSLSEDSSSAALDAKQAKVATELRIAMLQEEADEGSGGDDPKQPTADASRVDLLKQIDVVVAQQQSATSSGEDHDAQVAVLKSTLTRLADGKLDQDPPFSIVYLDGLKESVHNSATKLASADSSVVSARSAAEGAKQLAEERGKQLRQLKEDSGADHSSAVQIAELEQKLAAEMLVLKRQELSIAEANRTIADLQSKIDAAKVAVVGDRVTFSQDDLDEKLASLDGLEIKLKQQTVRLQSELQFAERRWMAARQEADSTIDAGSELLERVESLKVSEMALQLEKLLTNQRLQRIPLLKKTWERRFLVIAGNVQRKERNAWADETQKQIKQIEQDRRSRELKLDEMRISQSTIDSKIDAAGSDNVAAKRWMQSKREAYDKQAELLSNSMLVLDNAQRTFERLKTQIDGEPGRSPGEIASDLWTQAQRIWNYELAAVDETSLTVSKVCSSVLLLFFGFLLARWISGWIGGRLPRWGVDEAASTAIESLTFYSLLVTLGLTALRYANVPLTVFTFLGGSDRDRDRFRQPKHFKQFYKRIDFAGRTSHQGRRLDHDRRNVWQRHKDRSKKYANSYR